MKSRAKKTKGMTEEIKDGFWKFNYQWHELFDGTIGKGQKKKTKKKDEDIYKDSWSIETCCFLSSSGPGQRYVEIKDELGLTLEVNKRVGIVNWRASEKDSENALKGHPNTSKSRRDALFEVLNYAKQKRIEILIFPELAIPFEWAPLLCEQSAKYNICIIGGFEHFVPYFRREPYLEKKKGVSAYNLLFGLFPIDINHFDSSLFLIRIKNYYSPHEEEVIKGYHLEVPSINPMYDLVHWRKVYLSMYNCFELTNITDRGLYKGKIDFIAAVEFNKDVNYYSNIVESWARDLHCYILQSNPSDFGDSRIVRPTEHESKDIIRVKGGDFPLVLVTTLNITGLREHQRKAYNLQLQDKGFKPTPALYDWEMAEARIEDKSILK